MHLFIDNPNIIDDITILIKIALIYIVCMCVSYERVLVCVCMFVFACACLSIHAQPTEDQNLEISGRTCWGHLLCREFSDVVVFEDLGSPRS